MRLGFAQGSDARAVLFDVADGWCLFHRSPIVCHFWRGTWMTSLDGVSGGTHKQDRLPRSARQFGDLMRLENFPNLEILAMLKIPAYDPFAIAIMGFGVLFVVVLALTF